MPLTALVIFALAALAIWFAGVTVSDATDRLSRHYDLGEALGGLVSLAIVTNLPEIAIVGSASLRGDLELAIGNILGGIAVQTVVLALLDALGLGREAPLSQRAASPVLILEGLMVIAVLSLVILGHYQSPDLIRARLTPSTVLIAAVWLGGLWLIRHTRRRFEPAETRSPAQENALPAATLRQGWLRFLAGATVTLVAGVALEITGESLARSLGLGGALFGATVLAAVTALPEVSTGLESIRLRDYRMAVSDIFGGNAFLPVLFLQATLMSGRAVLPDAQTSDLYLTALAVLLTTVYLAGLIVASPRQWLRMGLDSWLVLLLYALGIAGLAGLGGR